jgi:hypothetical protein
MAYQLVVQTGPASGKTYPLDKNSLTIGREVGSDVFINEAEVSRRHARLTLQAGNYLLEDLGSTNGTFVNGQRLMGPRVLQPGDAILLGENVSLAFELAPFDPNAAPVGAPPPKEEPLPNQFEAPVPQAMPRPDFTPQPPAAAQEAYTSSPVEAYSPPLPPSRPAPPVQAYSASPPVSHVEPLAPEEPRRRRTGLWVGCGCLVVLLCLVVGGAYVVDSLNLYCTPPFRDVMVIFGAVCTP